MRLLSMIGLSLILVACASERTRTVEVKHQVPVHAIFEGGDRDHIISERQETLDSLDRQLTRIRTTRANFASLIIRRNQARRELAAIKTAPAADFPQRLAVLDRTLNNVQSSINHIQAE